MEKPVIADKSPIPVELKKWETYYYCTCGKSSSQPFCDGSHQGTSFEPLAFEAKEGKKLFYVLASILRIHLIVTEPIIVYKRNSS